MLPMNPNQTVASLKNEVFNDQLNKKSWEHYVVGKFSPAMSPSDISNNPAVVTLTAESDV